MLSIKTIFLSIFIFIVSFENLYPQAQDSLNNKLFSLLVNSDTHEDKISILYEMALGIKDTEPKRAISYLKEAIDIEDNISDDKHLIKVYYLLGETFFSSNKIRNSLMYFKKSVSLCAKYQTEYITMAMSLERIASIYNLSGKIELAQKSTLDAIKALGNNRDSTLLARCYNIIGNNYCIKEKYNIAISAYKKSYRYNPIALPLINIASCYSNFTQKDSAKRYLAMCDKILKNTSAPRYKSLFYDTYAYLNFSENKYNKAISYLKKSIKISTKFDLKARKLYSTKLLSDCYSKQNKFKYAYTYLNKVDSLKEKSRELMNYESLSTINKPIERRKEYSYINILVILAFLAIIEALIIKIICNKITILNLENIKLINYELNKKIEFRKQQELKLSFEIKQKDKVLYKIQEKFRDICKNTNINREEITSLSRFIKEKNQNKKIELCAEKELLEQNFYFKLNDKYNNLTNNERKLALYIRLDYSSKDIANTLNISSRSVNMNRYRLRKKLHLKQQDKLDIFLKNI